MTALLNVSRRAAPARARTANPALVELAEVVLHETAPVAALAVEFGLGALKGRITLRAALLAAVLLI